MFTIDRLAPTEIPEAASILARAFVDEPLTGFLLRDLTPERREGLLGPLFRTALRVVPADGLVHVARLDGRVVGLRVMFRSDRAAGRRLRRIPARLRMLAALARVVVQAPPYRHVLKTGRIVAAHQPVEPHWYFEWLAVDARASGRGAASLLAQTGVGICDDDGLGGYFATFTPVAKLMCERLGFAVTRELTPLPGGPTCWLMWRPLPDAPRRSSPVSPARTPPS